jgi:hypothetical protein
MTEAQLSATLIAQMRVAFRNAVVIKHADRATIGIPDISCTWLGKVAWIETKYLRPKDLRDFPQVNFERWMTDSKLQLDMMRRLSRQSAAFYLMYMKEHVLYAPGWYVAECINKNKVEVVDLVDAFTPELLLSTAFYFPKSDRKVLELIALHFGITAS